MGGKPHTLTCYGETDFIVSDEGVEGATHALIVNLSGPSNLPAYLLAAFRDDMENVGQVVSKHTLTQPHRVLCEGRPTWPVLRYGDTLFIIVNSPSVISNNPANQRNEWLFNYPPARDIALFLMENEVKHCATLTTWALNNLFTEEDTEDTETCIYSPSVDWSGDDAPASLQDLWAWVTPSLFESLTEGSGGAFIMPCERADGGTVTPKIQPALFPEIADMMRAKGFEIPEGAEDEAKSLYDDAVEEAMERIADLMGAKRVKESSGVGGMFA